jgi:hypothetical protein
METSLEKSGQRTCPEASVTTLNLFWHSLRQAHIEQYFFSDDITPPNDFPGRNILRVITLTRLRSQEN